jgi:hypothetical protein
VRESLACNPWSNNFFKVEDTVALAESIRRGRFFSCLWRDIAQTTGNALCVDLWRNGGMSGKVSEMRAEVIEDHKRDVD